MTASRSGLAASSSVRDAEVEPTEGLIGVMRPPPPPKTEPLLAAIGLVGAPPNIELLLPLSLGAVVVALANALVTGSVRVCRAVD